MLYLNAGIPPAIPSFLSFDDFFTLNPVYHDPKIYAICEIQLISD